MSWEALWIGFLVATLVGYSVVVVVVAVVGGGDLRQLLARSGPKPTSDDNGD